MRVTVSLHTTLVLCASFKIWVRCVPSPHSNFLRVGKGAHNLEPSAELALTTPDTQISQSNTSSLEV